MWIPHAAIALTLALSALTADDPAPPTPGPGFAAEGTDPTLRTDSEARSTLPLVGWWGPPPTDYNLAVYSLAFLTMTPMTLHEATQTALDNAQGRALSVMLVLPAEQALDLATIPEFARTHPAVTACLLFEGVTPDEADEAVRRARILRDIAPRWTPMATLTAPFPPSDPAWRAAAETLAIAGVPVLPHLLPFADDDTTDEARLYTTLRQAAAAAKAGGAPLWGMVQVTEHDDRRRASESDMRLQAYASLAYGARGLAYFTYWGPPVGHTHPRGPMASFGVAMMDVVRGAPSYGYEMARMINAEITLMATHLDNLEALGVYFAGEIPEGGAPLRPGAGPITRVESQRALIGFLRGHDGAQWAMVVNRQHGARRSARTQGRTMRLFVEEGVTAVHAIERQSGLAIPVPIEEGHFTITLPGGTGGLLRFDYGPSQSD